MRSAAKLLLATLTAGWLCAGAAPALSGPTADHACPSFEDAVKASGEQLVTLAATRGLTYELQPFPNDLRGAILSYVGFRVSPSDDRSNGLIFYLRSGRIVCGYLWRDRTGGADGAHRGTGKPHADVREPDAIFRLPVRDVGELVDLIERVRNALTAGGNSAERSPRLRDENSFGTTRGARALADASEPSGEQRAAMLADLSQKLFGETESIIEEFANLTVVPALNIGTVPFGVLDPNGDGIPLVHSTAVNVEASMNDVAAGRLFAIAPEVRPQTIAGDPDATGDPEWIFPRLPGAAAEARTIAARFEATPIIGSDATIETVTRHLAEDTYIHLAAHGLSSITDPVDGSFIALSDGRLTARAIQEMRLSNNPLVVLSACQTGLGNPLDAGIVGLARAFMLAGASSVIVSLWNVDDEATSWIMTRFVDFLTNHPPGTALRLAQDAARERWPEPSKWGAFVLFGSRTVVLAPADDDRPMSVALNVLPLVKRVGSEDMDPIGPGAAVRVGAGDELHLDIANLGGKPVDLDVLYADAEGTVSHLLSERVPAGDEERLGLVRFTDTTVGMERAIIVVREAAPASPLRPLSDFESVPGTMLAHLLLSPASLRTLLPGGIRKVSQFGGREFLGSFVGASERFELALSEARHMGARGSPSREQPSAASRRRAGVMVVPFEVSR
ncbi:CHAT domain-containing protein [Aquibium oceanicum]|uniref:CHAT domain-containing protein n=1 Tax=Aquibium oceanicum TaxID=1670800 RepID=A0A1L3SX93_9HYPH|nr:CHAT domain-containing protein [Aquibium oceanicum]APH74053.1 hypothetical protein BSQ44_23790 [Aquibium oceanicum]